MKKTDETNSIFNMLTAERQQELLVEAMGGTAKEILGNAMKAGQTLGDFLATVQGHDHHEHLLQLPMSEMFGSTENASKAKVGRKAKATTNGVAKKPRKARTAKAPVSEGDVVRVLAAVKKAPGQHMSDYAADVGLEKSAASKILKGLRDEGKIKTSGEKRATTYLMA